jgi:hypothetical protein
MEYQLHQLKERIEALPQLNMTTLSGEPEVQAKIALGLAFSLSSLYYSLIRSQGKVKAIQDNTILQTTITDIKARYQKLAAATKKRDAKL